jgi:hypothetical protein
MNARPLVSALVPLWNRRGRAVKNGKLMGVAAQRLLSIHGCMMSVLSRRFLSESRNPWV